MSSIAGGRAIPIRIEFDPHYRYPQHRWPEPQRPLMVENHGRATDPKVLADVERLVTAFAARYQAERGEAPRWQAGYGEAEIAAVETKLGVRLPEELRAFYRLIRDDEWSPEWPGC